MERIVSSVSRPAISSIRCLPQLMLATRGATQKAHRESFLNASSSNYIDEMYEQWSKDPQSVHKVNRGRSFFSSSITMIVFVLVLGSLFS